MNKHDKGGCMADYVPTREEAFALLREYNRNEGLINHALAVEGVMRHYARKFGVELSELITETIEGMKIVADAIGLGMKPQQ